MTEEKLIENEEESLEFWNTRFIEDGNVGWGSTPEFEWFQKKQDALDSILKNDMSILDICCGDFGLIKNIIEKYSDCNYLGIDGSSSIISHNLEKYPDQTFEFKVLSDLIKEKVNIDVIILYDVLFHVPDDKLYKDLVKWLFTQNAKYILLTYHETKTKSQEFKNGHFIPRPFKIKQKGYNVIFDTEFKDRNDLKLLVYEKN